MDFAKHFNHDAIVAILTGAQERNEVLALKGLGIGNASARRHSSGAGAAQGSPTSVVSSPVAVS